MGDPTEAAIEHLSRKLRVSHPSGKSDSGGRWYPDEELSCCKFIRSPSRSYPYSYMTHCRSADHVANEYGVELKDLKDALKKKNLPLLIGRFKWLDDFICSKLKED